MEAPLSELFTDLYHMSPLPFGPMSIPVAALKVQLQKYNQTMNSCQSQIRRIENMTGMRQFNHAFERDQVEMRDWKSLDLIDIARNLSGLLSRCAFLKSQTETEIDLVRQMQQLTKFFKAELERRNEDERKIDDLYTVLSQLHDNRSWYLGIKARCGYLTERTKAQIQTVRPSADLDRIGMLSKNRFTV